MALKVYLDSNDYSRFAELEKQSDAVRATYEALTSWVADRRIELRYSSVNVLEAAPLTPDAIPQANKRLQAIHELCGENCLIDVERLLRQEASDAAAPVPVFSDNGDWHPIVHDLRIQNAAELARELLAKASTIQTSKQMKVHERRLFDAAGNVRAAERPRIVELIKRNGGPQFAKHPVSQATLDTYYNFLLGRATRRQVMDALTASFADLKRWGQWYESSWGISHPFTLRLRTPAERLADTVRRLAAMLKILFEALTKAGTPDKEVQRLFKEKANPDAMRNILLEWLGPGIETPRPRCAYSWEATPAFETYSMVAMEVVRDSAMRVAKPRQASNSDFIDGLHLCYAPFVDVFRLDAYMAGVVSRCKLPIKTQFVGKLEELPSAIKSHPAFSAGVA